MPDIAARVAGDAAVASFVTGARALRLKTETALDALTTTTAIAATEDGAVTATVMSSGELTELTFTAAADGYPRAALAASVLATARQAHVRAVEHAEQRLIDVVGADNPAVAALQRGLAAQRRPTAVPRLVAPDDDEPVSRGD